MQMPGLNRLIILGFHARLLFGRLARVLIKNVFFRIYKSNIICPTHKRIERRAPVWGSEFTSKGATLQGGPEETATRLPPAGAPEAHADYFLPQAPTVQTCVSG